MQVCKYLNISLTLDTWLKLTGHMQLCCSCYKNYQYDIEIFSYNKLSSCLLLRQ